METLQHWNKCNGHKCSVIESEIYLKLSRSYKLNHFGDN